MALSDQAYRACSITAQQMADKEAARQFAEHVKKGRKPNTFRFCPTAEHRYLVELMGSHTATDEEAMAFLGTYDVLKQRFGRA